MKKAAYAILGAFLLLGTTAAAAPSVNGPTGMINTPTADTLRSGQFSIGYYHLGSNTETASLNFNFADFCEVGVAGELGSGRSSDATFNAKFKVLSEIIATPGLAVGVDGIGSNSTKSAYIVASNGLPFGFRVNAGVGGGRYNGMFASVEKKFNPAGIIGSSNVFPATSLICEYDGNKMNYGARMAIVPGLKFDLGLRENGHKTYFGLTYTN